MFPPKPNMGTGAPYNRYLNIDYIGILTYIGILIDTI